MFLISYSNFPLTPQIRLPDLGEQESIFEQLRAGKINMKQAGNMLGIDTSMLAYQLAGKVAKLFTLK